MNENILKWVWLTTKKGINAEKISSLLNKFNSIEEIYEAKDKDFADIDLIRKSDIKILSDKDMKLAEKAIEETKKCGAYIITYDCEDYPERLKYIFSPPYVLYVKGNLNINSEMLPIGVVGTREPVEYGVTVTRSFSYELARAGFTIVSGLALGIDAIAAASALKAGGSTIAVLGCGIDIVYPMLNKKLREYIEQYGAVITEYPPGTGPYRINFPQRNRIIAGLSECVLVTQAPKKSGALITAGYAREIGRKVYTIPASIYNKDCEGNNNLLKSGADAVNEPKDLIEQYKFRTEQFIPKSTRKDININIREKKKLKEVINKVGEEVKNSVNKASVNDERYKNLEENEKLIMDLIIEMEKISVDEIIRKTDLPPNKIGATLSLMEMKGIVKRLAGNFYIEQDKN